jgi:hypothetical protein
MNTECARSSINGVYTVKMVSDFPVPSPDVTNQLSLARNNGDRKIAKLFYIVTKNQLYR